MLSTLKLRFYFFLCCFFFKIFADFSKPISKLSWLEILDDSLQV